MSKLRYNINPIIGSIGQISLHHRPLRKLSLAEPEEADVTSVDRCDDDNLLSRL